MSDAAGDSVLRALLRMRGDPAFMQQARRIVATAPLGLHVRELSDEEVLRQLAMRVRPSGAPGGGPPVGALPVSREEAAKQVREERAPAAKELPNPTKKHWLELEFRDRSHKGSGIDNVVFCLDNIAFSSETTVPRGESERQAGFVTLDPLKDAVHPLLGSKLRAWLEESRFTIESVVWEGGAKPSKDLSAPAAGSPLWLVSVKAVTPAPGPVLDGLRALATPELDLETLLQFNFGVSPEQAKKLVSVDLTGTRRLYDLLYQRLGATDFDGEGGLVFSAEDEPGKLYLPSDLSERELALDQRHRFDVGRFVWPKLERMTQLRVTCGHGQSPNDHESAPIPRNYENPYFVESLIDGKRPEGDDVPEFIERFEVVPRLGLEPETAPTDRIHVHVRDTHTLPPHRLDVNRVATRKAHDGPSTTAVETTSRVLFRRGRECEYEFDATIPADDPIWGSKKAVKKGMALAADTKIGESGEASVEVFRTAVSMAKLIEHIQACFHGKSPYTYEVLLPGTTKKLLVDLYYPHTVGLTLALPPWSKCSAGTICNRKKVPKGKKAGKKGYVQSADGKLHHGTFFTDIDFRTTEEIAAAAKLEKAEEMKTWHGALRHGLGDPAEVLSKQPVAITINGQDATPNIVKMIGTLLQLVSDVLSIIQTCKDYVPAVGFYFDFDMQVLQGTFAAALGWAERSDDPEGKVSLCLHVSCALKLLQIDFEFGFGLVFGGAKIALFIKVTGSLDAKFQTNFSSKPVKLNFSAALVAEAGFIAEAGSYAEVKMTATSGLNVSFELRIGCGDSYPFTTVTKLEWLGLKGNLYVSASVGRIFGAKAGWEDHEFLEPKDLGEFAFPANEEYQPERLWGNEIKNIVKEAVVDWVDLRVETNEMSTWRITDYVMKAIKALPRVARDYASVEKTCDQVNKYLENASGDHGDGEFTMSEFHRLLRYDGFQSCVVRYDDHEWGGKEEWRKTGNGIHPPEKGWSWEDGSPAHHIIKKHVEAGINLKIANTRHWRIADYILQGIKNTKAAGRSEEAIQYAGTKINQYLEDQAGSGNVVSESRFMSSIQSTPGKGLWHIEDYLLPWDDDGEEHYPLPAGSTDWNNFKSMMHSALTSGYNIEVYNTWTADEIAKHIAETIEAKPGARLDTRSVEATAIAIVDRLKEKSEGALNKFKNDENKTAEDKFKEALADCDDLIPIDPGKAYLKKHASKL